MEPAHQEVESFVRSTFRSVWALELLLFLKRHSDRGWTREVLVGALRASDSIISSSLDSLIAAGLVAVDESGARYAPAAADLAEFTTAAESLYAKSPGAVRRMIVAGATGGLAAFSDAFRLRRD